MRIAKLAKRVVREAKQTDAHNRPWMVALDPGGFLEVRPKGTRQVQRLSFGRVYVIAAQRAADEERANKARERRRGH